MINLKFKCQNVKFLIFDFLFFTIPVSVCALGFYDKEHKPDHAFWWFYSYYKFS